MMHIDATTMTAANFRQVMFAAGFIPLCAIRKAEHWVRDDRRVIVHYQDDVASLPVEQHTIEEVLYAHFAVMLSGEIVLT